MFPLWESLLRRVRVRTAFFSARWAADHFARVIPGLRTHWLPEAGDPALYRPGKPLHLRRWHVLELGRTHDPVHRRIAGPLASAGRSHLFSEPGVRIPMFEGLEALYAGIAESAVMLCFPKSVTHPASAGRVETVTQRYFEAIGSGCLPVGVCPAELRDLFGFDPVVPLSPDEPERQLLDLLEHLEQHQPMVDRNLRRMREVGTFSVRATQMLAALETPAHVR
jgi:hypothetical protein